MFAQRPHDPGAGRQKADRRTASDERRMENRKGERQIADRSSQNAKREMQIQNLKS
jgi:hypothetical protein